jgi:very-short-patch-repair endonuclease
VRQSASGSDHQIARARSLRRAMTDAERKLWWHLRSLPVEDTHFRRQAPIGPYYADFACHRRKLIVEVDGSGHAEAGQSAVDAERTAFLESRGYRVLRFWNNEVLQQIDGVMSAIFEALNAAEAPPTPDPSPPRATRAGGGEPPPC